MVKITISPSQADRIHQRTCTLDTHVDIPLNYATPEVDPGHRGAFQVDLPKMQEGYLDAAFLIAFVPQATRIPNQYAQAYADAMTKVRAIHRLTQAYPDQIGLARTPEEVERLCAKGKKAACIGLENGFSIGTDITRLQTFYDLGARYLTLTHVGHNDIADSSNPMPSLGDADTLHGGLSAFGEHVIQEMNRLGMMIDISHTSKQTTLDAARLSRVPIIASHSSVQALCDVPRNMDDEALKAVKGTGGIVCAVALSSFLRTDPPEKATALQHLRDRLGITSYDAYRALPFEKQQQFREERMTIELQWSKATVSDFVDHIDYAVDLLGIDYVGISSDFDGGGGIHGWRHAGEAGNVTRELVRRGYAEPQVQQLWSGNFFRVWRAVESGKA